MFRYRKGRRATNGCAAPAAFRFVWAVAGAGAGLILPMASGASAVGMEPAGSLAPAGGAASLTVPVVEVDHAGRSAGVEQLLRQRNAGFSVDHPAGKALCDWLAHWVEAAAGGGSVVSAKYHDLGVAGFNAVQTHLAALREGGVPAGHLSTCVDHLAEMLITWRLPYDAGGFVRAVVQAGAGGRLVPAADASAVREALGDWPEAGLPAGVRKAAWEAFVGVNPAIRGHGWIVVPEARLAEAVSNWPGLTLAVPCDQGGLVRVYRYDIVPGRGWQVLIPSPAVRQAWTHEHARAGLAVEAVVFPGKPASWYRVELSDSPLPLRLWLVDNGAWVDILRDEPGKPRLLHVNSVKNSTTTAGPGPKPGPIPGSKPEAGRGASVEELLELEPKSDVAESDDAADGPMAGDGGRPSAPTGVGRMAGAAERLRPVALGAVGFDDAPADWTRALQRSGNRITGSFELALTVGRNPLQTTVTLDLDLSGAVPTGRYSLRAVDTGRKQVRHEVSGSLRAERLELGTSPLPAGAGWPQYHGAGMNGSAAEPAGPLVSQAAEARLAWVSAEPIPAGEWSDMRRLLPAGEPIIGGFASPVVSEGRVYFAYYRPAGEAVWEQRAREHAARGGWRERYRILADDVVLCVDAKTGQTLWKAVFPVKGVNRGSFHKNGFMGTPAVSQGRVFVLGTSGRVYALDAATGAALWESGIGPRQRQQQVLNDHCVASGVPYAPNRDFNHSPLVAGGVVVLSDELRVKDNAGFRYEGGDGLVGLDAATGRLLWHVTDCVDGRANHSTLWRHAGRTLVLAASRRGIVCIDPESGDLLWETPGGSNEMGTLAVDGDVLICHAPGDEGSRGVSGFALSLTGAKPIWTHAGASHGRVVSGFAAHRGRFFFVSANAKKLFAVDPATGRVLAEAAHETGTNGEHDNAFVVAHGDWVITSNGRGYEAFRVYRFVDDRLIFAGLIDQPVMGGYCATVQPAVVDGRMFARLTTRLVCLDLRAGR